MSAFQKVTEKSKIEVGKSILVEVGGEQIALHRAEKGFYAIQEKCSHRGGPLSEGQVKDCRVKCPWHGAEFDLRTGEAVTPPARARLKVFEVRVQDENVLVRN